MQQKLNLSSTFNRMKKSITVERKRTSNPATHQNYTIIYKENPQGSIFTELA